MQNRASWLPWHLTPTPEAEWARQLKSRNHQPRVAGGHFVPLLNDVQRVSNQPSHPDGETRCQQFNRTSRRCLRPEIPTPEWLPPENEKKRNQLGLSQLAGFHLHGPPRSFRLLAFAFGGLVILPLSIACSLVGDEKPVFFFLFGKSPSEAAQEKHLL